VINTYILSRTVLKLSRIIVQILDENGNFAFLSHALGLISGLLSVLIELDVTAEALRANIDWKSAFLKGG